MKPKIIDGRMNSKKDWVKNIQVTRFIYYELGETEK